VSALRAAPAGARASAPFTPLRARAARSRAAGRRAPLLARASKPSDGSDGDNGSGSGSAPADEGKRLPDDYYSRLLKLEADQCAPFTWLRLACLRSARCPLARMR
jgi:hypothetical protein